MDGIIVLNLFLVAVFIGLTAFFVGAEFAILKVRLSRLDELIAEGSKKAVIAKKVAHDLDYYLSACQLGITVTALVLGALGEPTVEKMLHPVFEQFAVPEAIATVLSYVIALSIITFLHVVIGELAPKTLAIQYAEKMTLLLAPALYWFGKIMSPFIKVLNGAAQSFLKLFGVKPAGHETVHSEEELKWIVNESFEGGEINKTELEYLKNIFEFDQRMLEEVMLPIDRVVYIHKDMSIEAIIEKLEEHSFTRYPVFDEQLNRFVGIVNTKEILTAIASDQSCQLADFIHDIPKFNAASRISDVLVKMQQSRVHMGIVNDANEKMIGIVAMEDLLEEIVGDMKDESINFEPVPIR